jgi:hypothetical protein
MPNLAFFFSDYKHVLVSFVQLNCLSLKYHLFVTKVFFFSLYRFACLQIPYGWWKHECNYRHLDILHLTLDFLVIYGYYSTIPLSSEHHIAMPSIVELWLCFLLQMSGLCYYWFCLKLLKSCLFTFVCVKRTIYNIYPATNCLCAFFFMLRFLLVYA